MNASKIEAQLDDLGPTDEELGGIKGGVDSRDGGTDGAGGWFYGTGGKGGGR